MSAGQIEIIVKELLNMFYLRKLTCRLLLVGLLNTPLGGQTVKKSNSSEKLPQSPAAAESKETPTSAQQRALSMLDPLSVATAELPAGINKVHIQAQIADALWEHDQPRARRRFEEVFLTINSIEQKKPTDIDFSSNLGPQLRGALLRWIVERDPAWANQLALSHLNKSGKLEYDPWMVRILLDTDPERAVQIIKEGLGKKNVWLNELLIKLRGKNSLLADDLFRYALVGSPIDVGLFLELFSYVFPDAEKSDTRSPLSTDLIKQFLDFGYRALMKEADAVERESRKEPSVGERAGYGYMNVVGALPFFEKHMPNAAPKIDTRWEQVILTLKGGKEHIRQVKLVRRPMSVEAVLQNANQVRNQEEKQLLYAMAAQKSAEEGDFDRAFLILEKIHDAESRNAVAQPIRERAAEMAVAKGNVDMAYRYSTEVEDLRTRIRLLMGVALLLHDRKEGDRAMKVINDAERSIDKVQNGPDKVYTMFKVASAATRLDPARGFEVMRATIEAINSAKKPDGTGFLAIGFNDFDENLLLLARADFDQAVRLARSITIREASILAEVAACRGVLVRE